MTFAWYSGDLHFSIDIESDGRTPGARSVLSIGATVAGIDYGDRFESWGDKSYEFYVEMQPIFDDYEPESLAVGGFDREDLKANALHPAMAIPMFTSWVSGFITPDVKAVFSAWPAAFDWPLMQYYFDTFSPNNTPFGWGQTYCIKQLYADLQGLPITACSLRVLPIEVKGSMPHTHNALDDARQQAYILQRLMLWREKGWECLTSS